MIIRPDEAANMAEIERDQGIRKNVKRGVKTAISIGAAIASPALAARILPLINEYVPINLAMAGINKISPKMGAFLRSGVAMGLNPKDGMDYIKDRLTPEEKPSKESTIKEAIKRKKQSFTEQETERFNSHYGQQQAQQPGQVSQEQSQQQGQQPSNAEQAFLAAVQKIMSL